MAKEKKNTIAIAEELAAPILSEMGLELWDVRFEKEGSGWFLRYFIDKPGGVDINDCEKFSRAVDPLLDEADPIDQSYCLEVSSPGVERELVRPRHFEENIGKQVTVRLIRASNGVREFVGTLKGYADGVATVVTEEGDEKNVAKNEVAFIRLVDDFDYSKGAE
ncbi:MAG: ribosome maturation factor RimP [Oscillospiraceae bacterium]|nr:ribosome maturation factor RimP [Oscillospiraceae bacterium]